MITNATQRWRRGRASYRPAGEVIDTSRYEVARVSDDRTAKAFVLEHHYERSYVAARERFGLMRGEDLVGVAVFSVPCNPATLSCLGCDAQAGLVLGRFVLLDEVPANGESWFLGRAFALLRAEGYEGVVSFSDPCERVSQSGDVVFAGHAGVIYQAHNAVYLGRSRAAWRRLLPDGRVLHNRALAKLRKRDRGWRYVQAELDAQGVEDVQALRRKRHPGNHKYAWGLCPAVRRALPASRPYPKLRMRQQPLPLVMP